MADQEKRLRLAVIAGAARALMFQENNSNATDSEVLQHVNRESRSIIRDIDED